MLSMNRSSRCYQRRIMLRFVVHGKHAFRSSICYTLDYAADADRRDRVTGDAISQHSTRQMSMSTLRVPLPARAEQTAIAEVLTDMDAELAALEQRRDKTRALKQAMMQELLTGKTRLVPAGGAHA